MEMEIQPDGLCGSKSKKNDRHTSRKAFLKPRNTSSDDEEYGMVPESKAKTKTTRAKNTETSDCFQLCSGGLENECCRRATFKHWPAECHVDFRTLAKEGFYYVNRVDEVICYFCSSRISGWRPGDKVRDKHKQLFSCCTFIQGVSNNIPLNRSIKHREKNSDTVDGLRKQGSPSAPVVLLPQVPFDQKTEERIGHFVGKPSQSPSNELLRVPQGNSDAHDSLLNQGTSAAGCDVRNNAVHPEFAEESKRLKSFSTWPKNSPVKKEDLASAGLFYVGINDHTKCFSCGKGLSNWEFGDEAWTEHRNVNPNCYFVKVHYGLMPASC